MLVNFPQELVRRLGRVNFSLHGEDKCDNDDLDDCVNDDLD